MKHISVHKEGLRDIYPKIICRINAHLTGITIDILFYVINAVGIGAEECVYEKYLKDFKL